MLLSLFLILLQPSAHAEYRVYTLTITQSDTGTSRSVNSTLDHIQYPQYYPLRKNEVAQIADSWMCWGRSDNFTNLCPNPRAPATAAPNPSSSSSAPSPSTPTTP